MTAGKPSRNWHIYDDLRPYINFFQPSLKLIAKERIGNRTLKRYDRAKTPYQRILERKDISLAAKARLMNLYIRLNPAELRRRIDQNTAKLWKISRYHSLLMQRYHQSNILS